MPMFFLVKSLLVTIDSFTAGPTAYLSFTAKNDAFIFIVLQVIVIATN